MLLWPIYGLSKRYSKRYKFDIPSKPRNPFRRSLHVFVIDAGSDVELLLEFYSLMSPKYNIHRYGIFFVNTPRHADLLVILSKPTEKMLPIVKEAINQMPEPFGVLLIENETFENGVDIGLPNLVGRLKGNLEAEEIFKKLVEIAKGGLIC
ncbi:MAG: NADH:ubiquinone oxidoreductase [Hydrogenobaculum sp.]|jgi:Ni,Fe-hydrogenase III small subunit